MQDAFKQFKETEDWRIENHLDVLYATIDVDAYEESRRMVGACVFDNERHTDDLSLVSPVDGKARQEVRLHVIALQSSIIADAPFLTGASLFTSSRSGILTPRQSTITRRRRTIPTVVPTPMGKQRRVCSDYLRSMRI
jgi:hypothetical protein